MYSWWRDVVREGTFESQHTLTIQKGLKLGTLLYIISEIMFFFGVLFTQVLILVFLLVQFGRLLV
jgi:heme/copper-type cytochrome/quinol oxidase subunit 3